MSCPLIIINRGAIDPLASPPLPVWLNSWPKGSKYGKQLVDNNYAQYILNIHERTDNRSLCACQWRDRQSPQHVSAEVACYCQSYNNSFSIIWWTTRQQHCNNDSCNTATSTMHLTQFSLVKHHSTADPSKWILIPTKDNARVLYETRAAIFSALTLLDGRQEQHPASNERLWGRTWEKALSTSSEWGSGCFAPRKFLKFDAVLWCILTAIKSLLLADDWVYLGTQKFTLFIHQFCTNSTSVQNAWRLYCIHSHLTSVWTHKEQCTPWILSINLACNACIAYGWLQPLNSTIY